MSVLFWRDVTIPLFTVVSVLLLLCTADYTLLTCIFLSVSTASCLSYSGIKKELSRSKTGNIHDVVRDGELLLVQDFLLAHPESVNEQR